jgi:hypothetical protein
MSGIDTTVPIDLTDLADDEATDEALEALTVQVRRHRSLLDILTVSMGHLWQTPNWAAATTIWVFAVITVAVTATLHSTRLVRTSLGPARVSCGLNVYVYGDPDQAVDHACRHALAGSATLFVLALVVVLAWLAATGVLVGRRYWSLRSANRAEAQGGALLGGGRWVRGPWVLVGLGVVGAVAALGSLRPVPLAVNESGTVVSVRCGADTYFGGYPDGLVQSACRRAYSGQAHVMEVSMLVAAIGLGALISILVISRRFDNRRLWAGVAAAVLAVVAAVTLSPVTVLVRGGAAPEVASCGLDTYLAGYPEYAVREACRSHYETKAAAGIPAGLVALILAGSAIFGIPRRAPERVPILSEERV